MPKLKDLMTILRNDFDPDDTHAGYSFWAHNEVESLLNEVNMNHFLVEENEMYPDSEDKGNFLERIHDKIDPALWKNRDALFAAYLDIVGDMGEGEAGVLVY